MWPPSGRARRREDVAAGREPRRDVLDLANALRAPVVEGGWGWGRGIMTRIVAAMVRHAWDELGLVRLTAEVFAHNAASMRVLEKNGFAREGVLRKHVVKDGQFIDAALYARVR